MNQASSEILRDLGFARESLLETVQGLSQEQYDFASNSEAWSIGEVLHHLYLTESQVSGLFEKMFERAQSKNLPLANADLPSQLHSLDTYSVVVPVTPAKAPAPSVPSRGIFQHDLLTKLEQSRQSLLSVASRLCQYDLTDMRFPHPLLGKINMYQWLLCVGQHERRHTRQVEKLKKGPA